jgi:hypothetical protein
MEPRHDAEGFLTKGDIAMAAFDRDDVTGNGQSQTIYGPIVVSQPLSRRILRRGSLAL